MECKRLNTDLIAGILMSVVAIFFWTQIGRFTSFGLIFPRAIIIILGITGISLIVYGLVKKKKQECFEIKYLAKMLGVVVLLIFWVRLLNVIGFAVTSFFFFIFIVLTIEDDLNIKNILKAVVVSAGLVGIFYITFAEILLVRLPGGIFF